MKYIVFGTVVLMIALCEAHLCLFNPHQRGSMNGINTAGQLYLLLVTNHKLKSCAILGSNDCILLDDPCGGRKAEKPMVGIV